MVISQYTTYRSFIQGTPNSLVLLPVLTVDWLDHYW